MQVWDFKGCALKSRWEVGCSLVKIVYHRLNGNDVPPLKDCSNYTLAHTILQFIGSFSNEIDLT